MLGDTSSSGELRKLVVNAVSQDPITFNDSFLGKPNEEYCSWIADSERWGGKFRNKQFCFIFLFFLLTNRVQLVYGERIF